MLYNPRTFPTKYTFVNFQKMSSCFFTLLRLRNSRTQKEQDWEDFRKKRKSVSSIFRLQNDKYYEDNRDNCTDNSTEMWKTLKNLISSNKNYGIP